MRRGEEGKWKEKYREREREVKWRERKVRGREKRKVYTRSNQFLPRPLYRFISSFIWLVSINHEKTPVAI